MKSWFTLVLICLCFSASGSNAILEKLTEINSCWREQKDIPTNLETWTQPADETSLIRLHLELVEWTLRSRSTAGLSPQQIANRFRCLDYLHTYRLNGRFPLNESYSYRTPVFIDQHDNFCAVGYLIKASGYEDVSRMIAANTNLAYVREMRYPELQNWATGHGFSINELAWIQPGYPPVHSTSAIGNGVDGEVNELFAEDAEGRLYVGGRFTKADSTLVVNNIAYVTESGGNYTWHSMDSGVNGPVHAIVGYGGKIYVAGSFTTAGGVQVNNVACWDGATWSPVGCIYGTVLDLAVMDNELYAAGAFDVCAAMADVNLARWNGTAWQQMPGLSGKINTMHVMDDTTLLLGGAFSHNSTTLNVMRWSPGRFRPFAGAGISNEVNDFEVFDDTLFAACRKTSTIDTLNLLMKLKGDAWVPQIPNNYLRNFVPNGPDLSFNTLCSDGPRLMLGGSFYYLPNIGTVGSNCINIASPLGTHGDWFNVDSTIEKMVIFKNSLIAGGKFKTGMSPYRIRLNGIAKREGATTSVSPVNVALVLECFPSSLTEGRSLSIRNNFGADRYVVLDLNGRQVRNGTLSQKAAQQVALSGMASGAYLIEVSNNKGEGLVRRFVIQ